jgi:hypothetical protein
VRKEGGCLVNRAKIPTVSSILSPPYGPSNINKVLYPHNKRWLGVEFLTVAQAHVVSFQFSMNLNHKQCSNTIAALTKITRRITMHKTQEVILGKPFSNKGKTQQPFTILPREDTLTP